MTDVACSAIKLSVVSRVLLNPSILYTTVILWFDAVLMLKFRNLLPIDNKNEGQNASGKWRSKSILALHFMTVL